MTGTRRWLVASLAAALAVLIGSIMAAVAWGGTWPEYAVSPMSSPARSADSNRPDGAADAAPNLPGTVVRISLTSMGGSAMGRAGRAMHGGGMRGGGMHGGAMRLSVDRASVAHGTMSFLATNDARVDHELVVMPLLAGQAPGSRTVGADNAIAEASSLGEASQTNGAGAGDGIRPSASGWVTLTLAPGHYELVCNLPGHYGAGMYTELDVT